MRRFALITNSIRPNSAVASINSNTGLELEGFAILVFPVVILGGLDSIMGTVVGGGIIGLLVEYTKSYWGINASQILPFVILGGILMMAASSAN